MICSKCKKDTDILEGAVVEVNDHHMWLCDECYYAIYIKNLEQGEEVDES